MMQPGRATVMVMVRPEQNADTAPDSAFGFSRQPSPGGFFGVTMNYRKIRPAAHLPALLILLLFLCTGEAVGGNAVTTLADRVQTLQLGMQGYVLGSPLTGAQREVASTHPVAGGYSGTYRFRDGALVVVVDRKTDRILAMYERQEDVGFDRLKGMVARLMTAFAEPTTMAHDRILYWAFTGEGQVSEEAFDRARKEQRTGELGILATVKFSSTMDITAGESGDESTEVPEERKGTIYFIISSDPMVQAFMADQG